jgi:hypothetical protein
MFGKQIESVAEPSAADRLQVAERDVDESTQEIENLHKEYAEYQKQHDLVMDGGVPVYFSGTSAEQKQTVHDWIIDFRHRLHDAELKFYSRCSIHAGLKALKARSHATN